MLTLHLIQMFGNAFFHPKSRVSSLRTKLQNFIPADKTEIINLWNLTWWIYVH